MSLTDGLRNAAVIVSGLWFKLTHDTKTHTIWTARHTTYLYDAERKGVV